MSSAVQSASELLEKFDEQSRKAAKRPNADAVHDVRVAIRRLRQCLRVFEPEFPARASQRIDKRIRKLLKAAGELRNLDIAIELLKKAGHRNSGLARVLRRDRAARGQEFAAALQRVNKKGSVEKWRRKLAKSNGSGSTPGSNDGDLQMRASTLAPALAAKFLAAGDEAARPDSSGEALHRFRIRTKKFRYTLELFAPVYGPELEKKFVHLREIQTRLGDINDCIATAALLDRFQQDHGAAVRRIKGHLSRAAKAKISGFRRFWTKSFDPEQKASWTAYLTDGNWSGITPK